MFYIRPVLNFGKKNKNGIVNGILMPFLILKRKIQMRLSLGKCSEK